MHSEVGECQCGTVLLNSGCILESPEEDLKLPIVCLTSRDSDSVAWGGSQVVECFTVCPGGSEVWLG